jgi:hypothetical protein
MAVKRKGGDKPGSGSGRPKSKPVKKARSSPFPKPPRPPSPAAPDYEPDAAAETSDGVLPPFIDEDD